MVKKYKQVAIIIKKTHVKLFFSFFFLFCVFEREAIALSGGFFVVFC